MPDRISRKQLEELNRLLSDRDRAILRSIRDYRYLTTDQIRRLHFTDASTPTAALRAASRNLKKLREMELIHLLDRRIGGVRSGSCSYIWYLAPAGEHLLSLTTNSTHPRRRNFQPSAYFLAHTLAVSECYVRITEICGRDGMKLVEAKNEPENWRPYNTGGKMTTLKPDLSVVTVCDQYEDRWFFEIDLATESPVKIIEKCRRYHRYYQCGFEQKLCGVFPLVVWVVPDDHRKLSLEQHVQSEFRGLPSIITIITLEELPSLICQGAGETGGEYR